MSLRRTRTVQYKKLRDDAVVPEYHTEKAAGFDLASVEPIYFYDDYKCDPVLFPTGLVIRPPVGHFLFITFRSSTPRKWGITVLNGILDEDYSGDEDEVFLSVAPLANGTGFPRKVDIPAGTRIAQGLFLPVTQAQFVEVESMGASRGGFGSTG